MLEIAEAGTAPLFLHRDSQQAEFAHTWPEVTGELVRAVNLGGARGYFRLREPGNGIADHVRGFAKVKVEGSGCVGDHRRNLATLSGNASSVFAPAQT